MNSRANMHLNDRYKESENLYFSDCYPGYRSDHRNAPELSLTPQASVVVIIEPTSFSEVSSAIDILRNNQVAVLNLMQMNVAEAQRAIDFVAGGVYMFEGSIEKIDTNIFLFTPPNTNITFDDSSHNLEDMTAESMPQREKQNHYPTGNTSQYGHLGYKAS